MDVPIREYNGKNSELGDISSSQYVKFFAVVDDRGRISIPSNILRLIKSEYVSVGYSFLDKWSFLPQTNIGSKNRISIPSIVRRSLAINACDKLSMILDSQKRILIMKNGRGSVADSIGVCGKLSRKFNQSGNSQKTSEPGSNPGRGPAKFRGDKNGG